MKKPRFDELTVLPVLALSALSALLICAGNWVRRVDEDLYEFEDWR